MRQKSMSKNDPAERTVRDIRRKTRKQYTAEEREGCESRMALIAVASFIEFRQRWR